MSVRVSLCVYLGVEVVSGQARPAGQAVQEVDEPEGSVDVMLL